MEVVKEAQKKMSSLEIVDRVSEGIWTALTFFALLYLCLQYWRVRKMGLPLLNTRRLCWAAGFSVLIVLTSVVQIGSSFFYPVPVSDTYITRVLINRSSDLLSTVFVLMMWIRLESDARNQQYTQMIEERNEELRKALEEKKGEEGGR